LLFKLFLRRERPDWLILNGDFQDFWEISSHDLTPRGGKDFKREIETGKKILRSFRRSLPRARITWIEGNHEFRLRKYLIQNARELYGLPGVSVPDIFDLKRLEIEYAPCHEMATKFTNNFIRVGDLYVGHWDKVSKHGAHAAKVLVEEKGVSLLQGPHPSLRRACADYRGWPRPFGDREFLDVRAPPELRKPPQLAAWLLGHLLPAKERPVPVVPDFDRQGLPVRLAKQGIRPRRDKADKPVFMKTS